MFGGNRKVLEVFVPQVLKADLTGTANIECDWTVLTSSFFDDASGCAGGSECASVVRGLHRIAEEKDFDFVRLPRMERTHGADQTRQVQARRHLENRIERAATGTTACDAGLRTPPGRCRGGATTPTLAASTGSQFLASGFPALGVHLHGVGIEVSFDQGDVDTFHPLGRLLGAEEQAGPAASGAGDIGVNADILESLVKNQPAAIGVFGSPDDFTVDSFPFGIAKGVPAGESGALKDRVGPERRTDICKGGDEEERGDCKGCHQTQQLASVCHARLPRQVQDGVLKMACQSVMIYRGTEGSNGGGGYFFCVNRGWSRAWISGLSRSAL